MGKNVKFERSMNVKLYDVLENLLKNKMEIDYSVKCEELTSQNKLRLKVYVGKQSREEYLKIIEQELIEKNFKNLNKYLPSEIQPQDRVSSKNSILYFNSEGYDIFLTTKNDTGGSEVTELYEGLQVSALHLDTKFIDDIIYFLKNKNEYNILTEMYKELETKIERQSISNKSKIKKLIEKFLDGSLEKSYMVDSQKLILGSLIFKIKIIESLNGSSNLKLSTIHKDIKDYYKYTKELHPFNLKEVKQEFKIYKNNTQDQVVYLSNSNRNLLDLLHDENSVLMFYMTDYELKGFTQKSREKIKGYIEKYDLKSTPKGTITLVNGNDIVYFYQISLKKGANSAQIGKTTQQIKAMTDFSYDKEIEKIKNYKLNNNFEKISGNINTSCNYLINILKNNIKNEKQNDILKNIMETTKSNLHFLESFINKNEYSKIPIKIFEPEHMLSKFKELYTKNKDDNFISNFIYKTFNNYMSTGQLIQILSKISRDNNNIDYLLFNKFFGTVSFATLFGNTILPLYKVYGYNGEIPYEYLGNYFSFFEQEGDIVNLLETIDNEFGVFNIILTNQKEMFYTLKMASIMDIVKKEDYLKESEEIIFDDLIVLISEYDLRTNNSGIFSFVIESSKIIKKEYRREYVVDGN